MVEEQRNCHSKYLFTVIVASILLVSLGILVQNAFAMGPGSCPNQYNGRVVVAKINNGTQTFDPLANPGVTIEVNKHGSLGLWDVIEMPGQSSLGKVTPGSAWIRYTFTTFGESTCHGYINPNENLTESGNITYYGGYNPEKRGIGTRVNGAFWTIDWVSTSSTANVNNSTAPSAPTNLSAWGMSSSQIVLSWNAPANYTVTSYKIERSLDGGNSWSTAASNTNTTVTAYTDSGLASHATYYYRVSAINKIGTSPSSNATYGTTFYPTLTIYTQDSSGNTISGFNATFSQNGNKVATALTPTTFTLTNNQNYDISMAEGGKFIFDHWLDNKNTNRNRSISISNDTILTAVYKQVTSTLTISSHDANGTSPSGFYTILSQGGSVINSGYTPVTFTLSVGQTYTIIVPKFSNPYSFDHWQDTGSTNNERIFTATTSDISLVAIYNTVGHTPVIAIIPTGTEPDIVAVNPNTNMIYSDMEGDNTIQVINGSTNQVVSRIGIWSTPVGLGLNPTTNTVYATDNNGRTYVINGTTNSFTDVLNLGGGHGIAANPVTNMIYMTNYNSNSITVMDGSTKKVISTIPVGNFPIDVAVNPNTNKIYVTSYNGFKVIDGSTNSVVSTMDSGNATFGVAVNPITNKIYVTNYEANTNGPNTFRENTVSVIDGSTNTIISKIPVGSSPRGIAVNPNTDRIYLSNNGNNTVSVIDGLSDSVISSITVSTRQSQDPAGVSINPNTNRIYVSNIVSNTIAVIDGNLFQLAVNSQEYNGTAFTGVNTNLSLHGNIVNSGYTPVTFALKDKQTYTVTVKDPPNLTFGYWADTGSNSRSRDISISADKQITAVFINPGNPPTPPQPPTGLTAFPSSPSQINLSWFASSDSDSLPITGYKIYRSTSSGTEALLTQAGNVTSYNDTTVTNGQTYFYKVTAVNSVGESPQSNEATATPVAPLVQTTSTLMVNSQDSYGNTLTGFYTELYAQNGTQLYAGYTPYNFTLNNGENYTVHVEDYGNYKFNRWADTSSTDANRTISITSDNTITAVYKTVPQPPTGLNATAVSSSQMNLTWNAPTNNGGSPVTSYEIKRSTDGSTWSVLVKNTGTTDTTYSDTGLSANTTYYYRVFTINDVGTSLRSNTASATTPLLSVAGTNVGPITKTLP